MKTKITLNCVFEDTKKKKFFFFLGFVIKERRATINTRVYKEGYSTTEATISKTRKTQKEPPGFFIIEYRDAHLHY